MQTFGFTLLMLLLNQWEDHQYLLVMVEMMLKMKNNVHLMEDYLMRNKEEVILEMFFIEWVLTIRKLLL